MGYYNAGIGAARINDSSPSDYTTYSGNKIETKQNATDNTLTTTSKNIVGAINEINSKVNNKFIIAQTLPVSDIDEFAIYLIPKSTSQTDNIYDEYIYISTDTPAHWEKIGDTEIDLSGYYTSSQVDGLLSNKQNITDNSLTTEDKTLTGAINELLVYALNIADEYDSSSTYDEGDFCLYEGVLYKCLVDISVAEAWDSTHWTSTLIVDNFGAGGGASVTLGTTVPSDASGDNGDLYVQYDSSTYAVVEYFVKVNDSWRKAPYSRVVSLTQAQYDLITPDPTTLYIITDAQSGYLLKSGGDITGTLTYKTDIDPSTAPSANKGFNIFALDDDNDEQLFRLETYQDRVNTIRGQMVVSRKVGNDTILNYFNMGIRPDGTKDVNVSDPDKWRSALGVPQKLKIGTDVRNFTDGVVYVPLSFYGLSSKPNCVLLTPARGDVIMSYDWDQSSATNGLKITCRKTNDLTGITGNVRFSIAIIA